MFRKRSFAASKQAMQRNTKFESGTKYWYFTLLDVVKHYQKRCIKGMFLIFTEKSQKVLLCFIN